MVVTCCHIRSSISSFCGGELEKISFHQLHLCQKGGKAVDNTGVDCDIAEAEVSTKGSIQEQEVPTSRPSSQEDQSHPETSYKASSN
ncbi:hypothetical protein FXO38_16386 [Capsicum annuum]|uniref:uncharacterized protein LOC107873334 isoform X2 n=1 Tax=Capsicum annuum TaxID=4072 RepID=UPI001FB05802|nr:uncharacterized protein LOC107873334 isoform X2 [Capsicum annuum]KAF3633702.1 hypothetical protein FXO37_26924 [Capsicum annuum]KAF3651910.1 hypothetical protein FXO38_16386 [Capsicum annuum]